MEHTEAGSQEKLDHLLESGTITKEDHARLLQAMETTPAPDVMESPETLDSHRLCKSWERHILGGVCSGIGVYSGIDANIIRTLAFILMAFVSPVVLLVYFLMYFMLPWDDAEAANSAQDEKHPWRFAVWSIILYTLMPVIFYYLIISRHINIFTEIGMELPAISQFALEIGDLYSSWFYILYSLIVVTFATMGYLVCNNRTLRFVYCCIFFSIPIVNLMITIVGVFNAIQALGGTIQQ